MVVYMLCFDLKQSRQEQLEQIAYWLDYLNSTLTFQSQSAHGSSKWCILLVGLRSDLQDSSSIQSKHLASWQHKYPRLVIVDTLFTVSSLKSIESVQELCQALEVQCGRIFDLHSVRIPSSYRMILLTLEARPTSQPLVPWELLLQEQQQSMPELNEATFLSALHYLHAIGRIVFLRTGMVCTSPSLVPQIAAKFVSPEDVQLSLLRKDIEEVQILSKRDIGCLLQLGASNNTR